jgi:hypothetical protein
MNRPKLEFPSSFEMALSTDELGLNVTEKIYYDRANKKMRI